MNNMGKKQIIFIAVIATLVVGAIGYFLFWNKTIKSTPENNTENTTQPSGINDSKDVEPIIKIEPVNDALSKTPVPDLSRAITYPASMKEDERKRIEATIKEIIARIQKNKYSFEDWLDLGIHRKIIQDYRGAEEAWRYAGVINQKSAVPFGNIANLYGYDIKNRAKAEENYSYAIKIQPDISYWYIQFAEYYRDAIKDNAQARAILDKAIIAVPAEAEELRKYKENFR